jgi:dTDP-glucose pyrophosphorylase
VRGMAPIAVNDCDHAFVCPALPDAVTCMQRGTSGVLLCFEANDPAYSYVKFDAAGAVAGTVEKQAVSPFAVAGCYLFASSAIYRTAYDAYRDACPYTELFISGLYNRLLGLGHSVAVEVVEQHFTFGTPDQLGRLDVAAMELAFGK